MNGYCKSQETVVRSHGCFLATHVGTWSDFLAPVLVLAQSFIILGIWGINQQMVGKECCGAQVKPLPVALACHRGVNSDPSCSFVIKLPARVPGKATEDDPSVWSLAPRGTWNGVSGF